MPLVGLKGSVGKRAIAVRARSVAARTRCSSLYSGAMRWRGPATVVYTVAALGLVPWAVALWWIQSRSGVIHHAAWLTSTLIGTVYVATLIAVGAAIAWPRWAAIAGSVGMTVAITATAFHVVTTGSRGSGMSRGVGLAALILVVLATSWLVRAVTCNPVPGRVQLARAGVLVGLALLAAPAAQLVQVTPALVPVSHLRFAWVGLDAAEILGLAVTAWCAWRRAWWGVITGSVTAALLFTDAARNVLATAGTAQIQAVAMSAIELPLAVGAIAVATLVPSRSPRMPAGLKPSVTDDNGGQRSQTGISD